MSWLGRRSAFNLLSEFIGYRLLICTKISIINKWACFYYSVVYGRDFEKFVAGIWVKIVFMLKGFLKSALAVVLFLFHQACLWFNFCKFIITYFAWWTFYATNMWKVFENICQFSRSFFNMNVSWTKNDFLLVLLFKSKTLINFLFNLLGFLRFDISVNQVLMFRVFNFSTSVLQPFKYLVNWLHNSCLLFFNLLIFLENVPLKSRFKLQLHFVSLCVSFHKCEMLRLFDHCQVIHGHIHLS